MLNTKIHQPGPRAGGEGWEEGTARGVSWAQMATDMNTAVVMITVNA